MRSPEFAVPKILLVHDGPSTYERVRMLLTHFGLDRSLVSIANAREMETFLGAGQHRQSGTRVVVVDADSPAADGVLAEMSRDGSADPCPVLLCGASRRMRSQAAQRRWSVSASGPSPLGVAQVREALELAGFDLSRSLSLPRFAINHDVL